MALKNLTRNWSDLHPDLLIIVVRKTEFNDFLAFRACCTSWRSVTKYLYSNRQFPKLLISKKSLDNSLVKYEHRLCNVFSSGSPWGESSAIIYRSERTDEILSDNLKTYGLGWRGWILVVEQTGVREYDSYLQHVFSQTKIHLPSLPGFHDTFKVLDKTALSSDPLVNPFEFTLMVISGPSSALTIVTGVSSNKLAFWKPGDENFTEIQVPNNEDIIFFDGYFYSITWDREIWRFDGTDPTKYNKVANVPSHLYYGDLWNTMYLVESCGELLFVRRFDTHHKKAIDFSVYKVPIESDEWTKVENLGDNSIFIGHNTSFSLNSSDILGCKKNCVYFTDRSSLQYYYKIGIYQLVDGNIKYSYFGSEEEEFDHSIHPLLWVSPTFM